MKNKVYIFRESKVFKALLITFSTSSLAMINVAWADSDVLVVNEENQQVARLVQTASVGSRSTPRSLADSPVPIDIIAGEDLSSNGHTNVLTLLASVAPSFNLQNHPISDAATLIRPFNLRGLSADSTLILVNGKRRHRGAVISSLGGGVNDGAQGADLASIPVSAVKRIEILRDGAAAQYGSDAIAGVINIVLKDNREGTEVSVQHGAYYRGDGATAVADIQHAFSFSGSDYLNLSFQYVDADSTSRSVQRDDAQTLVNLGNPYVVNPAHIWGSPKIKNDLSLYLNGATEHTSGGETYYFGHYSERDITGGFYYRHPLDRDGVFSNDAGETLLIANTDTSLGACPNIQLTNPTTGQYYDYDTIASAVDGLPSHCYSFFSQFPGGFTPNFGGTVTDYSVALGTKGTFGSGVFEDVFYDFSATLGANEAKLILLNSVNASLGPDSPVDFNLGSYTQEELHLNADFVKYLDLGLFQEVIWAFGAQWSEEKFKVGAGDKASYQVGPYEAQGFSVGANGFQGFKQEDAGTYKRNFWALYSDFEAEFTENLLTGFALRHEDYDSFGTTTNYKFSTQYRLSDEWAVRASTSSGFRAPTVGQANVSSVRTSNNEAGDLVDIALLSPTNPVSQHFGGRELQPEKSKSYALGLVYNNDDFFFMADLYRIDVSNRISQSRLFDISDALRAELAATGAQGVESLSQVSFYTNDFSTKNQGLDVVMNYGAVLFNGYANFNLAYNWNKSEVTKSSDVTGDFKIKLLEEALPKQRITFSWAQQWARLTWFNRVNYYSSYYAVHADDPGLATSASSQATLDSELSYQATPRLSVAVGAHNLLDTKVEALGSLGGILGGKYFENAPMNFNGGYWYLNGSYRF